LSIFFFAIVRRSLYGAALTHFFVFQRTGIFSKQQLPPLAAALEQTSASALDSLYLHVVRVFLINQSNPSFAFTISS